MSGNQNKGGGVRIEGWLSGRRSATQITARLLRGNNPAHNEQVKIRVGTEQNPRAARLLKPGSVDDPFVIVIDEEGYGNGTYDFTALGNDQLTHVVLVGLNQESNVLAIPPETAAAPIGVRAAKPRLVVTPADETIFCHQARADKPPDYGLQFTTFNPAGAAHSDSAEFSVSYPVTIVDDVDGTELFGNATSGILTTGTDGKRKVRIYCADFECRFDLTYAGVTISKILQFK